MAGSSQPPTEHRSGQARPQGCLGHRSRLIADQLVVQRVGWGDLTSDMGALCRCGIGLEGRRHHKVGELEVAFPRCTSARQEEPDEREKGEQGNHDANYEVK